MKKTLSSLAFSIFMAGSGLVTMTASSPVLACADSSSSYIGSVCTMASSYCPRGYAIANGTLLSISSNQALFALLGAQYGGDGRTTFALPDMRGRSAIGVGHGPGLSSVGLGQRRGAERQALNILELPSHSHQANFTPTGASSNTTVNVSTADGTQEVPSAGDYIAVGTVGLSKAKSFIPAGSQGTTVPLGGVNGGGSSGGIVTVDTAGNSQQFSIIPPQQALYYCINTVGIFPPRS